MRQTIKTTTVFLFLLTGVCEKDAFARDWTFGIGFNAGLSRLEGDVRDPRISPLITGHLRVLPIPYLAIDGELGYAALKANRHQNPLFTDFKTIVIPFELAAIVNLLPFRKLNPYLTLGGGGVYWNATNDGQTIVVNGSDQDGIDSFLKTGGGLEFRLSNTIGVSVGATYRISFTDAFDQLRFGDENDQVLDVHLGFTYYFNSGGDKDGDVIPDELDLMPDIAEDRDGYLDHDGIPEKNPNLIAMSGGEPIVNDIQGAASPVVLHNIVTHSDPEEQIRIQASVYSAAPLRMVAILYRQQGISNWNVVRMVELRGLDYEGTIPADAVAKPGLEYCVVAVDETLKGVGYSGLPSKPINVEVSSSGKGWRIVGGALGGAAVSTATYLIVRKQN